MNNSWYIINSSKLRQERDLLADLFPPKQAEETPTPEETPAEPTAGGEAEVDNTPNDGGKSFVDFILQKPEPEPAAEDDGEDEDEDEDGLPPVEGDDGEILQSIMDVPEEPIDVEEKPRETISDADFSDEQAEILDLSGKRSKASIDDQKITDKLIELRKMSLTAKQRRYVENNLQVISARDNDEITKASQKALSIFSKRGDASSDEPVKRLHNSLEQAINGSQLLSSLMVRLPFYWCGRAEVHRKIVSTLLRGIQLSSGSGATDIAVKDGDDDIMEICSRCYSGWGAIELVPWSLRLADFKTHLSPGELERLETGSPEEKAALRRRTIIDSMSTALGERIFFITIVDQDNGTRRNVSMMPASVIQRGFTEGVLELDMRTDGGSIGMDVNGELVATPSPVIVMDTDSQRGKVPVFAMMNGRLTIVCDQGDLAALSAVSQGELFMSEVPYSGQPLRQVQACFPDIKELVVRQCGNNITADDEEPEIIDPQAEEAEEGEEGE